MATGERAFQQLGPEKCLSHLLNSPGNFTASKLAWVKENEPAVYAGVDKLMLPGDFIAMKLTGEITTSISALSEGIFWDFKKDGLSKELFDYFDGKCSLEEAIELIKRNTRRFAKRHMTWFRRDLEIKWFGAGQEREIENYLAFSLGT